MSAEVDWTDYNVDRSRRTDLFSGPVDSGCDREDFVSDLCFHDGSRIHVHEEHRQLRSQAVCFRCCLGAILRSCFFRNTCLSWKTECSFYVCARSSDALFLAVF